MYIRTNNLYNVQDFEIHIQIAFTNKLLHTNSKPYNFQLQFCTTSTN